MTNEREQTITKLGTHRTIIATASLCLAEAVVFGISIPTGGMSTGIGMLITSLTAMCAGAVAMQKAAEIFDKKHPIPEREDRADEEQK